jgi:periplasmic copper chaperone A
VTTAGVLALPLLALAVAAAGPASAHVVVSSSDAVAGGYGKLEFRVPTESKSAKTVKLTVTLPENAPFGDVSVQTLPGWTVTTTERKLAKPITTDDGFTLDKAVATITWTATAGGVPPGQFEEFNLSVGPFPDRAGQTLAFPTAQTYSDGSVVRWDQPTQAGKPEPEHPAPSLTLHASTSGQATASSTPQSSSTDAPAAAAISAPAASGTDGATRTAAIGALVVAVLALILGAAAFLRARSR